MALATISQSPVRRETIMVVEDEVRSQRLVRLNLEPLGYKVMAVGTGRAALDAIDTDTPDLVLLDRTLPDADGFELCQRIRSQLPMPVIMLTACVRQTDKIRGFEVGADDYVTKPYDPAELSARIEAVLRRSRAQPLQQPKLFQCGALTIDFDQRLVTVNGVEVSLSRTEYRLLEYLALNAGRVLVVDAVLAEVWGPEYIGDYASLHLYISRLRRKLGEDGHNPRFIITKPGIGYMMPANLEVAPQDRVE